MTEFSNLLLQHNAWLFAPSAIALGALHGLEPGHSKTLMAAFIVAIRGTVWHAVLLGVSATVSHTAVVWAVAMAGLYFGSAFNTGQVEPYFQVASALIIVAVALWMIWRTWRPHDHGSHPHHRHGHAPTHDHSHEGTHSHGHTHDHGHARPMPDAHALAHARDIEQRFAGRTVSQRQIVLFGLTGGLIPCPASITVLMLCLQLKQVALGAGLVLCFSLGLALTLVASGAVAALGVRHLSNNWRGLDWLSHNAPYLSGVLMLLVGLVGLVVGLQGLHELGVWTF